MIEGMLVQAFWPSTSVYVIENGTKRFISSSSIFETCGYNWNEIVRVSQATLNMIPSGSNVSTAACPYILIQATGNPNVYVIENGVKRLITSANVFNACMYDWGDIVVRALPSGNGNPLDKPPCPYARRPWHSDSILQGSLVKGSGASVYVVDLTGKRLITSANAFDACKYRWNDVAPVSDTALGMMNTGSSVSGPPTACPHSLVQPPGPAVYVFENGSKRLINSAALFEACGYNWDEIVVVSAPGSGTLNNPPCPYARD